MRSARFAFADRLGVPAAFLLLATGLAAPAAAQDAVDASAVVDPPAAPKARNTDLSLSLGASAWHGDFGAATDTDITSVLLSARYRIGGLRLTAILPHVRIKSDGTFFTGLGGTPMFAAPNLRSLPRVRSGLGDLTLGASYLLPAKTLPGWDIELTGRIKVPTASDRSQLSTGKVDYSVGADLSHPIGRVIPEVNVTYRVFGDRGANWQFQNGFDVTAGASYAVTNSTIVMLNYEYARAASRFIGDSHELVLGASTPLKRTPFRLSGFVTKGLSQSAAQVSGGLALSFGF